jgi:hypothetical protein
MRSECSEHQEKIAAFFLGDLTEGEKQALEAHFATCSKCCSERDSYAQAIQQLTSAGEEDVPHHFFVYPNEAVSSPWQFFRRMRPGWQAAAAGVAALMLLLGIAAVSRLQVRSDAGGWAIGFGRSDFDAAAFKQDILAAAEKKNQESRTAWIQEVRSEIMRTHNDLSQQQQSALTAALAHMDARVMDRIAGSEAHVRDDTQKLVSDVYGIVEQQRAQDLEVINLRFDSTDATNAIKTRQTNEILGTLLQVADAKLR